MTGWYAISPSGAVAIGNLTPVGQNSGQVGCRWPPNGHHLAASLDLPPYCQIYGPFWHWNQSRDRIYIPLPQTTYCLDQDFPQVIFCSQWNDKRQQWTIQSEHQDLLSKIRLIGAQYLIEGNLLERLWEKKSLKIWNNYSLIPIGQVWQPLTLTHNSRDNYLVKEEGGFFAEMATLIQPGWNILVKILSKEQNKNYIPPKWSCLGAGGTPVAITPLSKIRDKWLFRRVTNPKGAILLTSALWQKDQERVSRPYPSLKPPNSIKAYAASEAIPWQSLVKKNFSLQKLTPGEWLTPAGAVYLWHGKSPIPHSMPLWDCYHRHALGYGHLWLFE